MSFLSKLFGGSNASDNDEEETPVLKDEHYPVDEVVERDDNWSPWQQCPDCGGWRNIDYKGHVCQ